MKKKKYILIIITLVIVLNAKQTKAFELVSTVYNDYCYEVNSKKECLTLYHDKDSNMAVFKTYNIVEQDRVYLNAGNFTTKGLVAGDFNHKTRLALQKFFDERYYKSLGYDIHYLFDPAELNTLYEKLMADTHEFNNRVDKHEFTIFKNEWTDVLDLPIRDYSFANTDNLEFKKENGRFMVKANKAGNFPAQIIYDQSSKVERFLIDRENYFRIYTPIETIPEVKFNVEEKKHHIYVNGDLANFQINIDNEGVVGDKVNFTLNVNKDYFLDKIVIENKNHQAIEWKDNSFIMPNEDVYINISLRKKQTYKITVIKSENATITAPSLVMENEKVTLNAKVNEGYILKKVFVNDIPIDLQEMQFVMPSSDVTIKYEVEKLKTHQITVLKNDGATIEVKNNANENEKVKVKALVENGYQLEKIMINNKALDLNAMEFIMPNEDVVITYKTKKVNAQTHQITVLKKDGATIEVTNHANENEKVKVKALVESGYQLDKIMINNKALDLKTMEFIMPNEDVVITYKTSFKNITKQYNIVVKETKGVSLNLNKKAQAGQKINLEPIVEEGYIIDKILVFAANNQNLEVTEQSFIMPDSDVTIEVQTKLKEYSITVEAPKSILVDIQNKAHMGEYITFSTESLLEDSVKAIYLNGKLIDTYHFTMPSEDVVLKIDGAKHNWEVNYEDLEGMVIKESLLVNKDELVSIPQIKGYKFLKAVLLDGTSVDYQNSFIMPNETVTLIYEPLSTETDFDIPNTKASLSIFPLIILFLVSLLPVKKRKFK